MNTIEERVEFVRNSIIGQFISRTVVEGRKRGKDFGITLNSEIKGKSLWLSFCNSNEKHSIDIPIPFVENNVEFIEQNGVRRALCKYYIKEEDQTLDFLGVMYRIICDNPTGLIPDNFIKKSNFLQRIIYSFENKNTSTIIYNLQRAMSEVITRMPLHETYMNSFVMNHRIIIVDREFDEITDPKKRLDYHVNKAKEYFHKGWTSIGLSDGSLADKNYVLDMDIKHLSPFGMKYHNPQRNLYSTLGMRGDELPLVRSKTMQDLMDKGLTRTGWNLFTVFADVPDNWEDQILMDKIHENKLIEYETRELGYGLLLVRKGQKIKTGQKLSVAMDGEVKTFKDIADSAEIADIKETVTNVGGIPTRTYIISIKYKRKLKDGVKLTNLAANKGVIRFKDLGYAIDPRDGKLKKIDILVSARAPQKRKNYTQILEALLNNVSGEKIVVLEDDILAGDIEAALEGKGFPKDGMWECETCYGRIKGIAGKVFWGVTHDVEDMLWDGSDTVRTNARDIRTAGLKFSTVEFRALNTRFGENNPITEEIMSYSQGGDDLHEELNILRSKRGEIIPDRPIIDAKMIKPVDQSKGVILPASEMVNTVADTNLMPEGFMLKLPIRYQTAVDRKTRLTTESVAATLPYEEFTKMDKIYVTDHIYVPHAPLRNCWRHETGNYGLSDIAALVNNIVVMCHRHLDEPDNANHLSMLFKAVGTYFRRVAMKMGSKRGDLSVYGMSVRYPFSAKAVATLTNNLPKNTIEIHSSMANMLQVKDGDIVLAERFPCLGFMSLRPQKIRVTEDEMCRYTIRVSSNSLGSMSLDFDGDVLFLASFHTKEAKKALLKEWTNPNKSCYNAIQELNEKAGKPHTREMSLQDYKINPFAPWTVDSHAEMVANATGVKSHTGPVIALAYNIMRIIENSDVRNDQKTNCAIELFLDKVGNSVFKQKHGVRSLHDIVIDAICTCDVEALVAEGFKRGTSTIICNVIKDKATKHGVKNLVAYHNRIKANGGSNIINLIVRKENMAYFASRALLEGCEILRHLEQPVVDIPSKMLKRTLSGKAKSIKTPLESFIEEKGLGQIKNEKMKEATRELLELFDKITEGIPAKDRENDLDEKIKSIQKAFKSISVLNRSVFKGKIMYMGSRGIAHEKII